MDGKGTLGAAAHRSGEGGQANDEDGGQVQSLDCWICTRGESL